MQGIGRMGRYSRTGLIIAALWNMGGVFAAQSMPSERFGGQSFDIPDPSLAGRVGEIYLRNCAACHDKGLERAPRRELFAFMSPQSVYRALTTGAMQTQAKGLSRPEEIAIAEFVTRRKMNAATQEHEPPRCGARARKFDFSEPPAFAGAQLSFGNTRAISEEVAGIDTKTVGNLRLKWSVSFPNAFQVRSEPTFAGGAIYIGSHNGGVYSLDRETGCARWVFQAGSEVRTGAVISPWKVGDRTATPLLYFGDIAGNIYALDAVNGKLVWRIRAEEGPSTITGTPTLDAGTLYVPVSSFEGTLAADPMYECCKFRGSVVAYDAANGTIRWKTYTTAAPKLVGENSRGVNRYAPSGAPVWNSPTIDTKRRQLYIGTGQNYSSPATETSDSIIAMDLASGAINWIFQALTGDAMNLACLSADKDNCPRENGRDFDFGGASAMLVPMPGGSHTIIAGQKSGDVYSLDPESGTKIWHAKLGRGGMLGGIHFGMAATSDLVFVPINDAPDGRQYPESPQPGIYALALATGKLVWFSPAQEAECAGLKHCTVGYSQAITVTPDLVFAGSSSGWMKAFDSRSGTLLWQVDTKLPVKTITGKQGQGGSLGGGAGPVVFHSMLFVSSGYSLGGQMPGNLFLAYEAAR